MMKARISATATEVDTAVALQLHGKTKIELFDAANGAKVYEQVDENMVTNALQHLVNLPAELTVMDNVSNRNCLPALYMPFLSKALSGLWVFSKQLTENEEYISPSTADVKALTGYAGGEYSGSNSKRGSLNLNESGAIDKGYRYVWDFATDKANGTVSCVSLVPRVQGNLGDSSENNMSGLAFSMCDFLNYSTSDYQSGIAKFSNQIGHYSSGDGILASSTGGLLPIYAERSDRCVYIYAVSVKQGDVYKFPIVNSNAIQITDITGALDLRYKYSVVWTNPEPFTTCNAEYYNGSIYIWSASIKTESTLIKLSLDGTVESTSTVTFDTELRQEGSCRLYDPETGMWYAEPYSAANNSIRVFDSNGNAIQNYSVTNYYCNSVYRIGGRKYIPINRSVSYSSLVTTYYAMLNDDGSILSVVRGSNATADSTFIKQIHGFGEQYPYFLQAWTYSNSYTNTNAHNLYIALNRALPLLCTVNNLSKEVIKTSSQTMKITYEITQG